MHGEQKRKSLQKEQLESSFLCQIFVLDISASSITSI
jgi:hypothetical protein